MIFACVFFVPKGSTQDKKTETAGEKYKNIEVLQDMPADQMGKVMNMMSSSLGVNCNFCHAENDFAKEGSEHKTIARDMLRMTFDINKKYFENRPEVNCNTCHQGRPHPPAGFPLVPSTREPRPAQPAEKPLVEDILRKYEAALGGKNNLSKIASRQIRAQRIEPDGKTIEQEEIWQKDGKLTIKTVYPSKEYGDYTVREIFDGQKARKFGNNSEIALKPDEAAAIRREAQIFAGADLRKIFSKIEFFRLEKIDGRAVYALRAESDDANGETGGTELTETLYFDAENGLLVRRTAATPTVLGAHVFQADYLAYKNFGAVKLPSVVKFAVPQIYWTRRILEVKNNAKIDDAVFSAPVKQS